MKKIKLLIGLLFISGAAFSQWEKESPSRIAGRINSFYTTSDLIYVTADDGVFSSSDGISWNFVGGGSYNGFYFASGVTANDTALIESSSYGVFYSKNNQTWTQVGNGVGLPVDKYKSVFSTKNKVLAQSSGGSFYSFNSPSGTWSQEIFPTYVNTVSSNGKDILVGLTNYKGAYRYDEGSSGWVFMDVFKDEVVNEFFQKGDTILSIYKKGADSVAISTDNGKSWQKNATPTSLSFNNSFDYNNNIVFLNSATDFYISLDNGLNWTAAGIGFPNKDFREIKIFKGYIYASSTHQYGEYYRRKLSQLSGIIYNGQGNLEAINIKNATYQWYIDGSPIQGADSRTLTVTDNGNYKVDITYHDGPNKMAADKVVSYEFKVDDLIVTNVINSEGKSEKFDIVFDRNLKVIQIKSFESNLPFEIEIYNMVGQVILRSGESQISSFDISQLQPGSYIVKVLSSHNQETIKIFKD